MADAGYALKYYICTPYRKPAALLPENEIFNVLFSTARVKIEHVNGILKARFTSLKGLRIQVKQLDDFVRVNEWIVVCIILYNILYHLKMNGQKMILKKKKKHTKKWRMNSTEVLDHLLRWFNSRALL